VPSVTPALSARHANDGKPYPGTRLLSPRSLSIIANVDLVLNVDIAKCEFTLVGPNSATKIIDDACKVIGHPEFAIGGTMELRGKMSPLSKVTLSTEAKEAVGIPADASHFAFAYPMDHVEDFFESFNLSAHPWAFFVLCGGFLYFNETCTSCDDSNSSREDASRDSIVSINAISLVPSKHTLDLKGPFPSGKNFAEELDKTDRLAKVTIDALQAHGFMEVSWVHPAEKLNGLGLGKEPYPHGAFLYKVQDSDGPKYEYYPTMVTQARHLSLKEQATQDLCELKNPLMAYFAKKKQHVKRMAKEDADDREKMQSIIGQSNVIAKHGVGAMGGIVATVFSIFLILNFAYVALLVAIGHGSDHAYAFIACLSWGFMVTAMAWIPLRATAMIALHGDRGESRLKFIERCLFVGLPLTFAVLDAILFGTVRSTGALFVTTHFYAIALAVVLPLALYYTRLRHADELLADLTAQSQQAVVYLTKASTLTASRKALLSLPKQRKKSKASQATEMGVKVVTEAGVKVASLVKVASPRSPRSPRKASTGEKPSGGSQSAINFREQKLERLTLLEKDKNGMLIGDELDRLKQLSVLCIQTRIRIFLAKRKVSGREIKARATRLRWFAWPIFYATLVNVFGNGIVDQCRQHSQRMQTGDLQWLPATFWLLTLLLGIVVLVVDLSKDKDKPTFSVAHAGFLVGVVYPSVLGVFNFNRYVYAAVLDNLQERGREDMTMSVCSLINICVMSLVVVVASVTLQLAARTYARAYMLLPLMFFQAAFQLVFFDLRKLEEPVTLSWFVMTCIVHTSKFVRNSGLTDPVVTRFTDRTVNILCCLTVRTGMAMKSSVGDPIFVLQYIADKGILYDLSDFCATGLVPILVSFFIARDGYFTLSGSGIFITSCDMPQLWLRFLLLLFINVCTAKAARAVLARNMRKTILGQTTFHGTSSIAAELVAEHKIVSELVTKRSSRGSRGEKIKKLQRDLLRRYLRHDAGNDQDEVRSIVQEFDVANLNYWTAWIRMMTRHPVFFTIAMVLQVISIYQVNNVMPSKGSTLWDADQYRFNGSAVSATSSDLSGVGAGILGDVEPEVCFLPYSDSLHLENIDLDEVYSTPLAMRWLRKESFPTTLALDPALDNTYRQISLDYVTCQGVVHGWVHEVNPLIECNSTRAWDSEETEDI